MSDPNWDQAWGVRSEVQWDPLATDPDWACDPDVPPVPHGGDVSEALGVLWDAYLATRPLHGVGTWTMVAEVGPEAVSIVPRDPNGLALTRLIGRHDIWDVGTAHTRRTFLLGVRTHGACGGVWPLRMAAADIIRFAATESNHPSRDDRFDPESWTFAEGP